MDRCGCAGTKADCIAALIAVANPPHPDEVQAIKRMGWTTGGGLTAWAFRDALRIIAKDR
ncbi:hypothetical protein [Aliiroseovarius sediminis]|uniref:hypothetical protein n=1 Tax=Aliiroseovarius sediminis TaxID=2925839 RepID=UPI001F55FFD6|nr:hypothetical protein [Aliiroseovarius sediminis]MCI2393733.1 hypothetical protein [Aliiroseovarius sediminis]